MTANEKIRMIEEIEELKATLDKKLEEFRMALAKEDTDGFNFEVRHKGKWVATFSRRWQAEKFAEECSSHDMEVIEVTEA